jgi:hypothetical protein
MLACKYEYKCVSHLFINFSKPLCTLHKGKLGKWKVNGAHNLRGHTYPQVRIWTNICTISLNDPIPCLCPHYLYYNWFWWVTIYSWNLLLFTIAKKTTRMHHLRCQKTLFKKKKNLHMFLVSYAQWSCFSIYWY